MYESFHVSAVPARERFAYFQSVVDAVFCPMRVRPVGEAAVSGSVEAARFGDVGLARVRMTACAVHRGRPELARLSAAPYLVKFQLRGEARWSQRGRDVHLRPGDFVIASMEEPYTLEFTSEFEMPVLSISPDVMRRLTPDPEAFLGVRMSGADADCGLLSSFVAQVVARMGRLDEPMKCRVEANILDLLGGVLAARARPAAPLPGPSPGALVAQIKAHVARHVGDRTLTPAVVAATFGISVRQLHSLFEREALSIGRYARQLRLETSRALLKDHPDRSLTQIAIDCGFYDLPHFSRCFRAEYGESPRDFRAALQRDG